MINLNTETFDDYYKELQAIVEPKLEKPEEVDTVILAVAGLLRTCMRYRGLDMELVDAVEAILYTEDDEDGQE